jgi:hypothetical protein
MTVVAWVGKFTYQNDPVTHVSTGIDTMLHFYNTSTSAMTNLLTTIKQQPIRCENDGIPCVLKDAISPRLKKKNSYLQRGTAAAHKKKSDERKNSTNDSLPAIISSPRLAAVDSDIISQSPGRRLSMKFHTPRQKQRNSVKARASLDDGFISGFLGSYVSPGAITNDSKCNSAKGNKKGFLGGSSCHGNTTSPADIAKYSDKGAKGRFRGLGFEDLKGNISQRASRRGERSVDTVVLDESGTPHQRRRRRRASLGDLEAMNGGSWSRLDTALGLEDIMSLLDVSVTPRKSPGKSKRKSRGSRDRDTNEGDTNEGKIPGSIIRRSSRSDDSKKSSAASKSPNNVKERESKGRRRSDLESPGKYAADSSSHSSDDWGEMELDLGGNDTNARPIIEKEGSSKCHSFALISEDSFNNIENSLAESLSSKTERKTTAKPTVERQGSSQRRHSLHFLANDCFLDSQMELGESVSKQIEGIPEGKTHQRRDFHRTVEYSIAKWSQLLDKRHKSDLESHDGGESLDGSKHHDSFQNLYMISDKDKTNGSRTIETAKAGLEGFNDNDIESDSGEITRKTKGIPSEENGGRHWEHKRTAKPTVERQGSLQRRHSVHCLTNDSFLDLQVRPGSHRTVESSIAKWSQLLDKSDLESHDAGESLDDQEHQNSFQNLFMAAGKVSDKDNTNNSRTSETA